MIGPSLRDSGLYFAGLSRHLRAGRFSFRPYGTDPARKLTPLLCDTDVVPTVWKNNGGGAVWNRYHVRTSRGRTRVRCGRVPDGIDGCCDVTPMCSHGVGKHGGPAVGRISRYGLSDDCRVDGSRTDIVHECGRTTATRPVRDALKIARHVSAGNP